MRIRSGLVLSAQPPVRLRPSGGCHSARTRTTRGKVTPSCSSLGAPCGLHRGQGPAQNPGYGSSGQSGEQGGAEQARREARGLRRQGYMVAALTAAGQAGTAPT